MVLGVALGAGPSLILGVPVFLIGLFLPSHRYVRNTTDTARPLPVVFDFLDGFKRFKDWTPIRHEDSKAQLNLSGPESGAGKR